MKFSLCNVLCTSRPTVDWLSLCHCLMVHVSLQTQLLFTSFFVLIRSPESWVCTYTRRLTESFEWLQLWRKVTLGMYWNKLCSGKTERKEKKLGGKKRLLSRLQQRGPAIDRSASKKKKLSFRNYFVPWQPVRVFLMFSCSVFFSLPKTLSHESPDEATHRIWNVLRLQCHLCRQSLGDGMKGGQHTESGNWSA